MKVLVNVKQLGKKRDFIEKELYDLPENPKTVRDLIESFVKTEVGQFNEKIKNPEKRSVLYFEKQKSQAEVGKIGFGNTYNENLQNEEKAIINALQSYEDGLFRIFIGMDEAGSLDSFIELQENDEITFIRLTMLAGRMW